MTPSSALSDWAQREVDQGGWIRRMFLEGQRLRAEFGDDAVADLSLGQPLPPAPEVYEAFAQATADRAANRFSYMPNLGHPDVRTRVAQDVGLEGVGPEHVAVTCGAAGAICIALRALVAPGDEVIGIAPYFPEFRLWAETSGNRFVVVESADDGSLDIDALAAALSPATGAVILNSPCNPSGHVLSSSELSAVAQLLNDHHAAHGRRVLLIVDEVYRRFHFPPAQRAEPFAHYEYCVLARSFSKDVGIAGERVGYLVLHPSLASTDLQRGLEMCMRALGFVNAPATGQRALLHLPSWDIPLEPYQLRHDQMLAGLRSAGLEATAAGGGLYLWVRSPWPDTLAFINELAARRVLFTPGVAFGRASHFRVCFSVSFAALTMATEVLAEVLRDPVSA